MKAQEPLAPIGRFAGAENERSSSFKLFQANSQCLDALSLDPLTGPRYSGYVGESHVVIAARLGYKPPLKIQTA
ncbi:hypothetical protein MKX08_008445 [Trichoderma sp. CBMAI-0020]|nr:hypothetical protein MKX08_008445 [Trichoderma sp. CBMAI-0020]